jgi:hypothetical protein
MKRVGILGTSVVAVLAFSAAVSAGAQAAEVTSCVKAAKVTIEFERHGKERTKAIAEGEFTNRDCTKAAPENTGKYQGYVGPEGKYERGAAGAKFSTKSGNGLKKPKLELADGEVVQCSASGGSGEWTGTSTGTQTVIFKGCSLVKDDVSGEKCTTGALNSGEIETAPLELALISFPEELVQEYFASNNEVIASESVSYEPGKVFVKSSTGAEHPYAAEFECGAGARFRILGTVAGHVKSTLNVTSKSMVWYVGPGEGVQDLRAEFSGDGGASYEPVGPARESYEAAATDGGGLEVVEPLDAE